jgi:hypothetical protein
MRRNLLVSGTVVDADTGESIPEFKITVGNDGNWKRRHTVTHINGRYNTTFNSSRQHLLRVEADRYGPSVSRSFKEDEGALTFDFALKEIVGVSGIVRLHDGRPAANAEIFILSPPGNSSFLGPIISNGKNTRQREDTILVEADAEGRFLLSPQVEPYSILVLHDEGQAEVPHQELKQTSMITLQPWARIEGEVRIGNKAVSGESVYLSSRKSRSVLYRYRTRTEDNGRFVFEKVPPAIDIKVGRKIKIVPFEAPRGSHAIPLNLSAGETTHVTIGGSGRAVIGQISPPLDMASPIDFANSRGEIRFPSPPYPPGFVKMSDEERTEWHEQWRSSEQGREFIKDYEQRDKLEPHLYAVRVNSDGTFRADDIPAGKYDLVIQVLKPPSGRGMFSDSIGWLRKPFEVSAMPGGRSDEPQDLGELMLKISEPET